MAYRCKNVTMEDRHYAERMQRRRKNLGLPLRAVCEATGLKVTTLWHYENALNKCPAARRELLNAYYSGLEAERRARSGGRDAGQTQDADLPELSEQTRKVLSSIIDQLTELLALSD